MRRNAVKVSQEWTLEGRLFQVAGAAEWKPWAPSEKLQRVTDRTLAEANVYKLKLMMMSSGTAAVLWCCNCTDVLSGYNGTIFAYGQTSSGKTHTMEVCVVNVKTCNILLLSDLESNYQICFILNVFALYTFKMCIR